MLKCPVCQTLVPDERSPCPSCDRSAEDSLSPTRPLAREPAAIKKISAAGKGLAAGPVSSAAANSIDDVRFVPGDMLAGRYRIVGLLGRGGMGEVYRADDLKLKQPVALKLLPERLAGDPAALARFFREVSLARQVSHRHVCRVYDTGEADGLHFLSMEYVRGEELASLLKRIGRLPQDKAPETARQLCAGLAAIHERGVLHRDLKPANVMIDERGDVRVTDFGLAGLAEEFRAGHELAGTPAYMSPEQLEGRELTVRSDIYALGLVLYEVFTGKRAFEGSTVEEIVRRRRASATPTSPSSAVKDLDPLVERVILRCLERDPDDRPASALQVAAALPGGDPLRAALAAGEVPSPEMVAAAPKVGSLRPAVAVACFAALLAGVALAAFLAQRTMLHNVVPLDKSPEVLAERSREVVRRLGYTDPPADAASNFWVDSSEIRDLREREQPAALREVLQSGQPPVFYFWYRQSPRYLIPYGGRFVWWGDPSWIYPGMSGVWLDGEGRLRRFEAVPRQLEEPQAPSPPDWSALFAEAGLDPAAFREAEPRWNPPYHNDARAAWEGVLPRQPQIPVRVEAAGYRGRPVYFELIYPWSEPYREVADRSSAAEKAFGIIFVVIVLSVIIGGALLAWRNVRLGRGDRRGAFRLALFFFAIDILRGVLWAHHVPDINGEFQLFLEHLSRALMLAATVWLVYVALEPFVRARWPHLIISWSRLLAGGWGDPLVGRDVLIGGTLGVALTLLYHLQQLTPEWLGLPPEVPVELLGRELNGMRGLTERVLSYFGMSLTASLGFLFIFLLFFIVLRRDWLAAGAFWVLLTFFYSLSFNHLAVNLTFGALSAGIITLVLMRLGLLALFVMLLFSALTYRLPLTTNFAAWYAGSAAAVMLLVAALAAYGFRTSLGGQLLFSSRLLED